MNEMYEEYKKIENQSDFITFLISMKQDLIDNKSTWENDSLENFIDGLIGYIKDKDQDVITWKVFAELLLAAKVYE
jgi:hypothetical protein